MFHGLDLYDADVFFLHWISYLVGGLVAILYFPIYWVANHPNWLMFFRGVAQPPTRYSWNSLPHPSGISRCFRGYISHLAPWNSVPPIASYTFHPLELCLGDVRMNHPYSQMLWYLGDSELIISEDIISRFLFCPFGLEECVTTMNELCESSLLLL